MELEAKAKIFYCFHIPDLYSCTQSKRNLKLARRRLGSQPIITKTMLNLKCQYTCSTAVAMNSSHLTNIIVVQ